MRERIVVGLILLLILAAYGFAGEMEYRDQVDAERYAAVYYAGLK